MSIPFSYILVGVAVAATALALATRPKPKAKTKRTRLPDQGTINGYSYFVEHLNGAVAGDRSPAVIAFHGRGGTADGIANWMRPLIDKPVHLIVPTGKQPLGKNSAWWMERAANDQYQLTAEMAWTAEDVKPFLRKVRSAYGKPTVVGHSQGAMVAALLAAEYPKFVRNAVAAAAWLPRDLQTARTAPLVVVHGSDDPIIPYDRTYDWIASLPADVPVSLVTVPGAGHNFSELRDMFESELSGSI